MDFGTLIALRSLNLSIRRHVERSAVTKELNQLAGPSGWIVGYLIEHEDTAIYQRDLEKEFGMCRSTASKLLATLEQAGFIVRERVPHDDHLKKIILTPLARQYGEKIRENNREIEQELISGFSEEELQTLHRFLDRMQRNITEP